MNAADILKIKSESAKWQFTMKQIVGLQQALKTGGFVQQNADWNSIVDPTRILNKPTIPSQLSQLTDDTTHRLVTDTEIATWNGKQDSLGFTPENAANKDTDGTMAANSDTKYPSQKAVRTYVAANGGSGGGILTGPYSSRPTAGVAGRYYICSDGVWYPSVDNGSSWDVYVVPGGIKCVNPPPVASFTEVNFAGTNTTLAAVGDGLRMTQMGTNTGSDNCALAVLSLPVAPYKLTVGIDLVYTHPFYYSSVGIALVDGVVNPKQMTFQLSQTSTAGIFGVSINTFSSLTAWQSTRVTTPVSAPLVSGRCFIQIYDDGANRNFMMSATGNADDWGTVYSCSRTDYLTPTYGGLWIDQSGTVVPTSLVRVKAKIFHWQLG